MNGGRGNRPRLPAPPPSPLIPGLASLNSLLLHSLSTPVAGFGLSSPPSVVFSPAAFHAPQHGLASFRPTNNVVPRLQLTPASPMQPNVPVRLRANQARNEAITRNAGDLPQPHQQPSKNALGGGGGKLYRVSAASPTSPGRFRPYDRRRNRGSGADRPSTSSAESPGHSSAGKKAAEARGGKNQVEAVGWEERRERAMIPLRPNSRSSHGSSPSTPCSQLAHDDVVSSSSSRTMKAEARDDAVPAAYRRRRASSSSSTSDDDHSESDERDAEQQVDLEDEGVAVDDFSDVGESDVSSTDDEQTPTQRVRDANYWVQTVAAGRFYQRRGTTCLEQIHDRFEQAVANRISLLRAAQPKQETPPMPAFFEKCECGNKHSDADDDGESSDSDEERSLDEGEIRSSSSDNQHSTGEGKSNGEESDTGRQGEGANTRRRPRKRAARGEESRFAMAMKEVERKRLHPSRLHADVWFNESGQTNDGPLCRCSWKSRQTGVRHDIFAGESRVSPCDPMASNNGRLFHYAIAISPDVQSAAGITPTAISYDSRLYILDGFSVFLHRELPDVLPPCNVQRANVEYTITFVREPMPELFHGFLFDQLMEMVDLGRRAHGVDDGCPIYHAMPRFVRTLPDGGKELLSMSAVLEHLHDHHTPLIPASKVEAFAFGDDAKFAEFANSIVGELVVDASKRPSTIRVDGLERSAMTMHDSDSATFDSDYPPYPKIVHFGVRPSSLTYNGNPEYQRVSKQYVKLRHLLTMKPKLTADDKQKLSSREAHLRQLRLEGGMKRDVTVMVSSRGFYRTGLKADIVQALLMVLACQHARFHWSLLVFERERIHYSFRNRALLELAFTHPSYRTNYGTNADHARNTLSNCGMRQMRHAPVQVKSGTRKMERTSRKRGINTLLDIMSRHGSKKVKQSPVANNERLEYLGDAVIEFLSTIHLFFIFPDLEEGGLATYRSSLVQNKHLAMLAKKLGMDEFMLYAHGPDLCHETDLRHAMANAFEAVMGAVFLDGGLQQVDRIFGEALFNPSEEPQRHHVWTHLPKHPLQAAEPNGDRHYIRQAQALQKLVEFEQSTGIHFRHIRLLAKAFTRRNVGYNYLTLGHNQRLEFLGDTVLQLITSEYLYKHFPDHHEGHLSLLRSCLVNNKTQSVICDDLGITRYILHPPVFLRNGTPELRLKDKADLVEAFLGALYVDRGLEFCKVFCRVCFYPRLKYFIVSQRWNDPKSQLQQCCLTLRNIDGGEPDIPEYRTIGVEGPTNTRVYKVAVYFRKQRLAAGTGHSVQEAQMRAAELALQNRADLFPSLTNNGSAVANRAKRPRRRGGVDRGERQSAVASGAGSELQSRANNATGGQRGRRNFRSGISQQRRGCLTVAGQTTATTANESAKPPGKKIQSLFDIKFN